MRIGFGKTRSSPVIAMEFFRVPGQEKGLTDAAGDLVVPTRDLRIDDLERGNVMEDECLGQEVGDIRIVERIARRSGLQASGANWPVCSAADMRAICNSSWPSSVLSVLLLSYAIIATR